MISIVTGGAGFIGSHLVELLVSRGHYVKIIDDLSTGQISNLRNIPKQRYTLYKLDLSRRTKKLRKILKNSSYIFHIAGKADIVPSIENPMNYFNSNVNSTLYLLEALKGSKIKKLIYAASASCYGIPSNFPTNEKSKLSPMYPYALTKKIGEDLIMHWDKVFNIPSLSFRFFNAYGPRSRTSGAYGAVFGTFLAQKIANKPLTIVGNGKQTREFIYVKDLVKIIVMALIKINKSCYLNVGSDEKIRIKDLINLIANLSNFNKKIIFQNKIKDISKRYAYKNEFKRLLNYKNEYNLKTGLMETIKWYKKKLKK